MLVEINRWFDEGCDWQRGTDLYKKMGTDSLLLSLCNTGKSSFAYEKLKQALKKYVAENTPIVEAESFAKKIEVKEFKSGKVRKTPLNDEVLLTNKLRKKKTEIGKLYKEVIRFRREMHKLLGTADKKPISLEEAFSLLEQVDRNGDAIPCELLWVTYNSDTDKGGEAIRGRVKFRGKHKNVNRYLTGRKAVRRKRTNPRHDKNGTVNIQLANTLETRKIHTWCIFEINGRPVNLGNNG